MSPFATELIAICRCFGMFERDAVCCGTVTVQQCVVLQMLLEGEREMSELAEQTGVSTSAMTRLVDGLERNGWVYRTRDGDDRRRVASRLTAEGKKEAARLRDLTETAAEAIRTRIPPGKRRQTLESLKLLRQAVTGARDALSGCCGP